MNQVELRATCLVIIRGKIHFRTGSAGLVDDVRIAPGSQSGLSTASHPLKVLLSSMPPDSWQNCRNGPAVVYCPPVSTLQYFVMLLIRFGRWAWRTCRMLNLGSPELLPCQRVRSLSFPALKSKGTSSTMGVRPKLLLLVGKPSPLTSSHMIEICLCTLNFGTAPAGFEIS